MLCALCAIAILVVLAIVAFNVWEWYAGRESIPAIHTLYVFVTGCDTGFGRRLARRLDTMGCHVFAACYSSSAAKELAAESSERVTTVQMDVTKDDDIERALKEVTAKLPQGKGLWGIVNNAGIMGPVGPAEMMTREDFLTPLKVNLLGMTQVTRHFLPLVRRESGRIVNTVSVVGKVAASPAPYVASKFAAMGYTDMLRRELHHHKVSVHAIMPGAYTTNLTDKELTRKSLTRTFQQASPAAQKVYGQDYVEKVMGTMDAVSKIFSTNPEEVVDAYVHALTSKRPSLHYIVGKNGNLFFRPLWMMPTRLADWILTRQTVKPNLD